ncbi:MAG: methyltransferase [Actinobacteria bacterium]|nr:methyltransferase [Actinomycetota bacterium]
MDVRKSWDAEYRRGRYRAEPPVDFVKDIVEAARRLNLTTGLYIGCGNGRNYIPLVESGLDLIGLDTSEEAIAQLAERAPDRRDLLVHGSLSSLAALSNPRQWSGGRLTWMRSASFEVVIGIQVFQHGTRAQTHEHIAKALALVAPGGLFCIRVNATGTDLYPAHETIETAPDGGFTVRYTEGPKEGLAVHFFSAPELSSLVGPATEPLLPLRLVRHQRMPKVLGSWAQWEAIWRR